jgi:transposase
MPFNGKSAVQITSARCRRASGIAAVIACRKDTSPSFPALPSHLAVGRGIQFGGSSQFGRIALYQRPSLGQTVSRGGVAPAFGAPALRATGSLPCSGGVPDHRDCHFSSSRPGSGIHHLVSCQVGRICPFPPELGNVEQRDHSADLASSWFKVSHRPDLVPEYRSGFRGKKNAIIRLYRDPPSDGPVVCLDELGPLQTIPRGGQSWSYLAARRSSRYSREKGTLQFFAAFCPHTGVAAGRGAPRKTSEDCRNFLQEIVVKYWPHGRIHLILDNLSSHKASPVREWANAHPSRIQFHWLPTNSSWLNLIESYFSTLHRVALHNTDYQTPEEIEGGLLRGIAYLNQHPKPYIWKKI